MNTDAAAEGRKTRVLAAAAEHLRSANVEWSKALTYDLLAELTGIDKKQISTDFGPKREMMAELVRYCLDPSVDQADYLDDVTELGDDLLVDEELDIEAMLRTIADTAYQNLRESGRLHSEMALWALASEDRAVRDQLSTLYAFYDDVSLELYRSIADRFERAGITPRSGLTPEQLVAVLDAVLEGLAIRASIDPDIIPGDLYGTVMVALFEALFPADGSTGTIGDRLAELPPG